MTWTALPDGDRVTLGPGELLALVASVKATHTSADLHAYAGAHGLQVLDYAEEGQRAGLGPDPDAPGYRYVAAIVRAGSGGFSLPWGVPFPLSLADSSGLVRAWSAPAGAAPGPAPAPPAPSRPAPSSGPPLWPIVAALGIVGAGAWWSERRRRRRR